MCYTKGASSGPVPRKPKARQAVGEDENTFSTLGDSEEGGFEVYNGAPVQTESEHFTVEDAEPNRQE